MPRPPRDPQLPHPSIHADMARLEGLLHRLLRGEKVPGLPPGRARKLIDIACGRADEAGVLSRVFGKGAEGLEIIGADIRDREIGEAGERWTKGALGGETDASFLVHDGTRLDEIDAMDGADVAFLRHQNYWNGREVWERIFEQTTEKLNDDGLLIITSYFDREHELAKKALKEQGLVMVEELRNENSRATGDAAGKSVDRWVAGFRKG